MIPLKLLLFIGLLFSHVYSAEDTLSFNYDNFIRFHWKGALASHSITMKIFPKTEELEKEKYNTFLVFYTKSSESTLNNIKIKPVNFSPGDYPVGEVNLEELLPATQYYYTFLFSKSSEIDIKDLEITPSQEFSFKTFETTLTPANFTFGFASCARTGSNSPVFQNMLEKKFDFFLHTGDFHYEDIKENDVKKFYEAYYKVFSSPNQKAFYEQTPITYVWDDHDFGPNDAIGTSPSKPAATEAYRKFVPYYPLKNYLPADDSKISPEAPQGHTDPAKYQAYKGTNDFGIFRSFIIGRCLFILMDLRSFLEVEPGDILGEEQKTWLENQVKYAGYTEGIKMVFLVSSFSWIFNGGPTFEEIKWASHRPTQKFIVDLIQEHIDKTNKKIMLVCGDAHMLAFDDGRNNQYGGFPVVQAASIDRSSNCKGGPYSHGAFPGKNQYGIIEVTDVDDKICVKINLMQGNTPLIMYDTCHPELYPSTKSAKCHPTWGDFTKAVVGASGVIGMLIYCIVRRRKSQGEARNSSTKIGYGYENMSQEMRGNEEMENGVLISNQSSQKMKIEMITKNKNHKGD